MEGRNLDMGNLLSAMEVGMAWGSERGERERETERERPRERERPPHGTQNAEK